jgi:hypothetical protein
MRRYLLALTESGGEFGWVNNRYGQLGVDVWHSSEPIIIDFMPLKFYLYGPSFK